jgi:integral membrane protein
MRRDTSEVAPDLDRSVAPSGSVGYGLLIQYRILAFTTATLLIVLVFVGIPLQVAAHSRGVVNVVGTLHGFLYLVYLVVAFRLTYKLKEPIWKMGLILLAGTVPFCAFIAERKVTRDFNALTGMSSRGAARRSNEPGTARAQVLRKRWLSRRALLLHLEVAVVAPGCAVAGWWQATRALAGNGLSWVYSVEWPLFSLLAIWGWWHLIHEDPEAYRRRRLRASESGRPEVSSAVVDAPIETDGAVDVSIAGTAPRTRRDSEVIRSARILAVLICAEFVLGFVALALVPFGRRSGWFPPKGEAIYLVHAIFGAALVIGATVLLIRSRDCTRAIKLSGRFGFAGLLLAAAGGLLVADQSLIRFLGMTLMLIGAALSVFGYMIPGLHSSTRDMRVARVGTDTH